MSLISIDTQEVKLQAFMETAFSLIDEIKWRHALGKRYSAYRFMATSYKQVRLFSFVVQLLLNLVLVGPPSL